MPTPTRHYERLLEDSVTEHASALEGVLNHDNLQGYVAAEHIDWSVTGAEDVHADRIGESAVTQHEAAIDHDALTNYVSQEHIRWDQSGAEQLHDDRLQVSNLTQFTGGGALYLMDQVDVASAANATLSIADFITDRPGLVIVHGTAHLDTAGYFRIRAISDTSPLSSANYSRMGAVYSGSSGGSFDVSVGDTTWEPFSGNNIQADALISWTFVFNSVALDTAAENSLYMQAQVSAIFAAFSVLLTWDGRLILGGAADDADDVNALYFYSDQNFSDLHAEAWEFFQP